LTVPLIRPTADSAVLVTGAAAAVRAECRQGFKYAKAGAVLSDLRAVGQEQAELGFFSAIEAEATSAADGNRLVSAMDALNHRFGRDPVGMGSTSAARSGAELRVWATKQERRSPRYTTRWEEISVVRTK
jgi:DNA polymerase V